MGHHLHALGGQGAQVGVDAVAFVDLSPGAVEEVQLHRFGVDRRKGRVERIGALHRVAHELFGDAASEELGTDAVVEIDFRYFHGW